MRVEKQNFLGFIWHAIFLALTMAFVEVNTVIPSMIMESGGGGFAVGLSTAIMVGIPLLVQLLFAGYLTTKPRKKPFLIFGIYLRIAALFGIVFLLRSRFESTMLLLLIFIILSIFSFSGVFAGICYTDLLGKGVALQDRKTFMTFRQIAGSGLSLLGAFLARYIVGNIGYPNNYSIMFFIAAISLVIASFGFFAINEKKIDTKKMPGFWTIMKSIPLTLKKDTNLLNYILFTNFTGFGLVLIPFYVMLAKENFGLSGENVGNFLLFQMGGMLLAGFMWRRFLLKRGLKKLLQRCVIIGTFIPILSLILAKTSVELFVVIFLLSAITLSARKISFEWLLIEITDDENRSLYTGVAGALNLVTALLPLLLGTMIEAIGFLPVFIASSVSIISGLFFLNKIRIEQV
ncbi:MAG: MFS transporter [Kosmotogaceae bacterium]